MNALTIKKRIWNLLVKIHSYVRDTGVRHSAAEMDVNETSWGNEINEYQDHQQLKYERLVLYMMKTGDLRPLDDLNEAFGSVRIDINEFAVKSDKDALASELAEQLLSLGDLGKVLVNAKHPDSPAGEKLHDSEINEITSKAFTHIKNVLAMLIHHGAWKPNE